MISNPERTQLISSLGWVDQGDFWRYDVKKASVDRFPSGTGARYLSVHSSGSERFSVVHHFDGTRVEVTVHSFAEPVYLQARAVIGNGENSVVGDAATWDDVPLLYVAYLNFAPWQDFVLLKISPSTGQIGVQRLEWYDQAYDKGYQGVIDVIKLPDQNSALISVQRSSQLILHDLDTGTKKESVDLGGRGGNPDLRLRQGGAEIWASDYDSLVVVRTVDLRVVRSAVLQDASEGTRQFIGNYSFAPEEESCVVARPYSGDAVSLNCATLKVKAFAQLGSQPLDVAALHNGEVVARDWKTGDVLRGTLR